MRLQAPALHWSRSPHFFRVDGRLYRPVFSSRALHGLAISSRQPRIRGFLTIEGLGVTDDVTNQPPPLTGGNA
ncbi:hypothetical protein, partial [Mesorhizobium sp. M7A.F.Ca.US.006.04.2.1]|uniref:hypothetical protein n=1 Tax=Mesorhizobium sp. M7A.F.Ca.US.006.04.2.1 TaxID=2496696 RepID=UPI0019D45061